MDRPAHGKATFFSMKTKFRNVSDHTIMNDWNQLECAFGVEFLIHWKIKFKVFSVFRQTVSSTEIFLEFDNIFHGKIYGLNLNSTKNQLAKRFLKGLKNAKIIQFLKKWTVFLNWHVTVYIVFSVMQLYLSLIHISYTENLVYCKHQTRMTFQINNLFSLYWVSPHMFSICVWNGALGIGITNHTQST